MASICRTTGIWAVDLALIRIIKPGANQSTTALLSLKTRKEKWEISKVSDKGALVTGTKLQG
jgi:hypothetical protein